MHAQLSIRMTIPMCQRQPAITFQCATSPWSQAAWLLPVHDNFTEFDTFQANGTLTVGPPLQKITPPAHSVPPLSTAGKAANTLLLCNGVIAHCVAGARLRAEMVQRKHRPTADPGEARLRAATQHYDESRAEQVPGRRTKYGLCAKLRRFKPEWMQGRRMGMALLRRCDKGRLGNRHGRCGDQRLHAAALRLHERAIVEPVLQLP